MGGAGGGGSGLFSWLKAGPRRSLGTKGVGEPEVVDGSDIKELVGHEQVFATYIDHKFGELDRDRDGKLSVEELQPAVADIGAALGLPAKGESSDSDHAYSEVLDKFTKEGAVSKAEFKKVMSDILLGMAAGLERDPVVILRMDGEDLMDYLGSTEFELDAISIYSKLDSRNLSLNKCLTLALEKITVQNGMPPSSDSWVFEDFVKPALLSVSGQKLQEPAPQEHFLANFRKVLAILSQHLKEQPVIVAHSEKSFDGSQTKSLLSNEFELDKFLNTAWRNLSMNHEKKASKDYLRVLLDDVGPSAGLPPYGAIGQVDAIIDDALKIVSIYDGKEMRENKFKNLVKAILGSIMLQLEGSPVHVSSSSVVHEPIESSSSLLTPSISLSVSSQNHLQVGKGL